MLIFSTDVVIFSTPNRNYCGRNYCVITVITVTAVITADPTVITAVMTALRAATTGARGEPSKMPLIPES